MAWPKNTKASTANVDAGTDLISNARGDIKQNIDNVNDIIDTFDIGGDSAGQIADGDILQYSSSASAFQPVASTSIGSAVKVAVVQMTAGEELESGFTYRRAFTIHADPDSLLTEDSTGDFTFELSAGTYVWLIDNFQTVDGQAAINLHEEGSGDIIRWSYVEVGTTATGFFRTPNPVLTVTGTKSYSFRQSDTSSTDRNAASTFTVLKIA